MSEVIAEIDRLHRAGGADNGSFFCAVQFGEGTSHPHGVPGDPTLAKHELILIDTGCTIDGYHSDITRTYALDKQSQNVETLWQLEKEAQAAAFDAAQIGRPCGDVDAAARSVLEAHGLGPDYQLPGLPHRTGHGIGLEIHEGPYLVRGDDTPLAAGMCFSNEPMIVVPDHFGRIYHHGLSQNWRMALRLLRDWQWVMDRLCFSTLPQMRIGRIWRCLNCLFR